MATISDIPDILGQYMLRGWTLTDKKCPTRGCTVPLMRNPTSPQTFCAKCDGSPTDPQNTLISSASSGISSESPPSRSSTPPTDISEVANDFVIPPETEGMRRRREQSDQASSEIGRKLLQGWAMLGDECPNATCYGVPLVRPPNTGGERDPQKLCVICGSTYTTEVDHLGREFLRPTQTNSVNSATPPPRTVNQIPQPPSTVPINGSTSTTSKRAIVVEDSFHVPGTNTIYSANPVAEVHPGAHSTFASLDESRIALQGGLNALNGRLISLSGSSALDPASIASTADAISRVTQALTQVRQLQWSESQVVSGGV